MAENQKAAMAVNVNVVIAKLSLKWRYAEIDIRRSGPSHINARISRKSGGSTDNVSSACMTVHLSPSGEDR